MRADDVADLVGPADETVVDLDHVGLRAARASSCRS